MYWSIKESNIRLELAKLAIFDKNFLNKNLYQGGYGCGYVHLPLDHIWYFKHYDELNDIFDNENFDIHGSLTYSNLDENNLWKIGFDTNHFGDNLINWSKDNLIKETIRLYNFCYSKYKKTDRKNKIKNLII